MPNLKIKAVVTKADGSLFYREEHEWPNVDAQMLSWFQGKLQHLNDHAHKLNGGKKEDGANLNAELTIDVDGQVQTTTLSGVSYHSLTKFEREAHKAQAELLDIGENLAKSKK